MFDTVTLVYILKIINLEQGKLGSSGDSQGSQGTLKFMCQEK